MKNNTWQEATVGFNIKVISYDHDILGLISLIKPHNYESFDLVCSRLDIKESTKESSLEAAKRYTIRRLQGRLASISDFLESELLK